MKGVEQFIFPEVQFGFENRQQLFRVEVQNFIHRHFDGAIIANHHDTTGDGGFAGGENIESLFDLFQIGTLRKN